MSGGKMIDFMRTILFVGSIFSGFVLFWAIVRLVEYFGSDRREIRSYLAMDEIIERWEIRRKEVGRWQSFWERGSLNNPHLLGRTDQKRMRRSGFDLRADLDDIEIRSIPIWRRDDRARPKRRKERRRRE